MLLKRAPFGPTACFCCSNQMAASAIFLPAQLICARSLRRFGCVAAFPSCDQSSNQLLISRQIRQQAPHFSPVSVDAAGGSRAFSSIFDEVERNKRKNLNRGGTAREREGQGNDGEVETETIGPTTVLVAEQLPEADLRVSLERNGRTGGKLIRLVKALKRNREEEGVFTLQKVAKLELPDQAHAFVDSLDELLRNFARKTDGGKRSYRDLPKGEPIWEERIRGTLFYMLLALKRSADGELQFTIQDRSHRTRSANLPPHSLAGLRQLMAQLLEREEAKVEGNLEDQLPPPIGPMPAVPAELADAEALDSENNKAKAKWKKAKEARRTAIFRKMKEKGQI